MYILYFYVPDTHLEIVKDAIFTAGAGHVGPYSHCAWETLGEGQYMPLAGSDAFIGDVGCVEKVAEYKVEVICTTDNIKKVISALKEVHPYETPAYHVLPIADF